jgi:prevent-host-death family protein
MDVSVRELRNHTGRVVSALEAGEPVVLTVHGRPVADIVPRVQASERRPSELLLAELGVVSTRAAELGVQSDAADFDVGWTTDDLVG